MDNLPLPLDEPPPSIMESVVRPPTPVKVVNGVLVYDGWPREEDYGLSEVERQTEAERRAHSVVRYLDLWTRSQQPEPERLPPREFAERLTKPGFVYFLHDPGTDWIKIGFSATPEQRLALLTSGSARKVLLVIPGTMRSEHEFHVEFAADLAHGKEWFRRTPALEARIAALAPPPTRQEQDR